MQRGEIFTALILASIIISGSTYNTFRGGDKTSEIAIVNSASTPFDAETQFTETKSTETSLSTTSTQTFSPTQSKNFIPRAQATSVIHFLNRATQPDLEAIPGIGKAIAQRIIAKRETIAGFKSKSDILSVSGIGDATYQKIAAYVIGLRNRPQSTFPASIQRYQPSNQIGTKPIKQQPLNRPIPFNQATRDQLMQISGIGPHIADAILFEKNRLGKFKRWREIKAISGIGEQRLKSLQQHFSLPN